MKITIIPKIIGVHAAAFSSFTEYDSARYLFGLEVLRTYRSFYIFIKKMDVPINNVTLCRRRCLGRTNVTIIFLQCNSQWEFSIFLIPGTSDCEGI